VRPHRRGGSLPPRGLLTARVDSGWSAAAGDDLPQGGSGVANGLVVPVALNPSPWASRRPDQPIFSLDRPQPAACQIGKCVSAHPRIHTT
jgi:hypothetical protein